MKKKKKIKYDLIDKVLEQCLWLYTFDEDNRKNIYYDRNTGRIINKVKEKLDRNSTLSSFPIPTDPNHIYATYLENILVSKEKAYTVNKKSNIFNSHTLIKQRYWSLSAKINEYLTENYPELLV